MENSEESMRQPVLQIRTRFHSKLMGIFASMKDSATKNLESIVRETSPWILRKTKFVDTPIQKTSQYLGLIDDYYSKAKCTHYEETMPPLAYYLKAPEYGNGGRNKFSAPADCTRDFCADGLTLHQYRRRKNLQRPESATLHHVENSRNCDFGNSHTGYDYPGGILEQMQPGELQPGDARPVGLRFNMRFGLGKWANVIAAALLISPALALDNQIAPIAANPMAPANLPHHVFDARSRTIGVATILVAGYLSTTTKKLLAPLMGISSVLWFIMRNDSAIKPAHSWTVFGFWSVVTLMYLSYQSGRVANDKLYILLSLAFGGVCLFIVALVQKASIQGGLVTAIPPCTSFAAYAIAFCFPNRRSVDQVDIV